MDGETTERGAATALAELREPDDRTLHFTPRGRGIDILMVAEDSAEYWLEVVSRWGLHPSVAEGTRRSFEDLKKVFGYGVLCYEIYTLIHDHALLILEQALRDRFLDYHAGTVSFEIASVRHDQPVTTYGDVWDFIAAHRRPCARLIVDVSGATATMDFNGTLFGLRSWARRVGLLCGQRNRAVEAAIAELRNSVAHSDGYHLFMPTDAARTLNDLAEIINHLWGHDTPGGRVYPTPLTRYPVALAWNPDTSAVSWTLAHNLLEDRNWNEYTHFAVVQSVWDHDPHLRLDPRLPQFDSLYERTPYPVECLWGPGARIDAVDWMSQHPLATDTCTNLDRLFVVRVHDRRVYLPMRPMVAAAAPPGERAGQWHLVRADVPDDALVHVRQLAAGTGSCRPSGPCPACLAETVAQGSRQAVLLAAGIDPADGASLPADFSLPGVGGVVRSIGF